MLCTGSCFWYRTCFSLPSLPSPFFLHVFLPNMLPTAAICRCMSLSVIETKPIRRLTCHAVSMALHFCRNVSDVLLLGYRCGVCLHAILTQFCSRVLPGVWRCLCIFANRGAATPCLMGYRRLKQGRLRLCGARQKGSRVSCTVDLM